MLHVAFALAALIGAQQAPEDLVHWLDRLGAATAAERALAERRVAALARTTDEPLMRARVLAGDDEVRGRLSEVLGGEDRLFALAARFSADSEPILARVGRAALDIAIERFDSAARRGPSGRDEVSEALRDAEGVPIALDAEESELALDATLDLVVAAADEALPPVIVDPDLSNEPVVLRGNQGFVGGTAAVVEALARVRRGRLDGYGFDDRIETGAVRWLVLTPRPSDAKSSASAPSVRSRLVNWCLDVAQGRDPAHRAASARALAALGWPAARMWFEDLWRAHDDDAALEGLLLVGARFGAPSVFQESAARERLWTALDAAALDPKGERRALRIALALGAAGRVTADGNDEGVRAIAGLDSLPPRPTWLRLVVLERWQPANGPVVSALDGLLARSAFPPALRFQALRARGGSPLVLHAPAEIGELIAWCVDRGRALELARRLHGAEGWPPAAWADPRPTAEGMGVGARLAVLHGWISAGRTEVAAAWIAAALAREPDALDASIVALLPEVDRSTLTAALDACARLPNVDVARLALSRAAAGLADPDAARALISTLEARAPESHAEWLALGGLAAGPGRERAQKRLPELVTSASDDKDLLAALTRAIELMRAARLDSEERELVRAVKQSARQITRESLRRTLRSDPWPPPPSAPPRRAADVDRRPSAAGL